MNQVIVAKENKKFDNELVNDVFRVRHETFIERLGWDITSENGMERDSFDDLDAHHIVVADSEGAVSGCWRALPTTNDYMLKNVFPELLQGEDVPESEDVWEISRFAVRKGKNEDASAHINEITLELFKTFREFAKKNGIKKYVTVTTMACERILKRGGMKVRRMGEGKVMQIGVERTVALWIDLDESSDLN